MLARDKLGAKTLKKWTKMDILRIEDKKARRFLALPVGGLGGVDQTVLFRWPVAADYVWKTDDKLHPEGFKEYTLPLGDPDLFSSLARLSENGEPSRAKIRRWVCTHGLLTRENFRASHDMEDYCGDPISLEEFRAESREAHEGLTLFNALRLGKPDTIRRWIDPRRTQQIDAHGRPKGPKGLFADAYLVTDRGELDAKHIVRHRQEPGADVALSVALNALQERIREEVDLELRFEANFEHPHPLGGLYRSVPVLTPRSLLGAAWLQFCLYVADLDREWRLCLACGRPFRVTRKDQTTCPGSAGCQKKRQRLEKAGR